MLDLLSLGVALSDLQGGEVCIPEFPDYGLPPQALPRYVFAHPSGKFSGIVREYEGEGVTRDNLVTFVLFAQPFVLRKYVYSSNDSSEFGFRLHVSCKHFV